MLKISHSPDGKNAHALVLILTCTTAANASVIFSMYVPQRTLKTSHRPDGRLTFLLVVCRGAVFVSMEAQSHSSIAKCIPTKLHMCGDSCSKVPLSLMGNSRFARCLQGGGVWVQGGTVAISSCTISGNTAENVRAQAQSSHRPDGKMADVLASTPASTTAADAPVNYSMYVPQRPSMLPIAPMGRIPTCLL